MDFLGRQGSAVEELLQARHEFLGSARIQKSDVGERLFPVLQQTRDLLGIGQRCNRRAPWRIACGRRPFSLSPSPQGFAPFVRNNLHRAGQVERTKAWIGRDAQRHMAPIDIVVGHAKALRPEEKRHPLRSGLRQGWQMLPGGSGGRTKVARHHGRGAQVGHALECLVQGLHDAGVVQHVQGPTGTLDGFLTAQHIGPARSHQHQVIKPHDLHGPCHTTDVTGMAGLDQDEAGAGHGHRHR